MYILHIEIIEMKKLWLLSYSYSYCRNNCLLYVVRNPFSISGTYIYTKRVYSFPTDNTLEFKPNGKTYVTFPVLDTNTAITVKYEISRNRIIIKIEILELYFQDEIKDDGIIMDDRTEMIKGQY
ncbi:MAG: hypothetical protein QXP91_05340 [Candidatus Methanomethylicia archaeon]